MNPVVREEDGTHAVEVVRGQLDRRRLEALRQALGECAARAVGALGADAAQTAQTARDEDHHRPAWPGPLYGDRRPSPWRRPAR